MRRSIMACGGWIATCLILVAGCQSQSGQQGTPPPSVRVVRVERAPASISLTYTATLRGSVEVRVFSQIPDRIRALYVDQGDEVKRGQLLAIITHNALSSGLEAALAGQSSAAAQAAQLRSERDRLHKLFEAHAVGEAQVDRIEKQVQSAEAGVRQLEAMVNQAATQQDRAFVRAPIDGVIGQRFVEQGDMAVPQIPLVTIVQMDELKADLMVPEFELPRIERAMKSGYPVRVTTAGVIDGKGERTPIAARIVRISPTIDLATRMATVEVRIDNRQQRLRPGMLAEVEVVVEKNDAALLVPAYAVLSDGVVGASGREIKHVVFTVESGKAHRTPVVLGMNLTGERHGDSDKVEVVEGLKQGDLVVVRGQHLLKDAEAVDVKGGAGGLTGPEAGPKAGDGPSGPKAGGEEGEAS